MKTALDRFMEKVWPEALTGCWLWVGAIDQHGYGHMTVSKRHMRAHRFALQVLGGVNLDSLDALHHCDNPSCVNPAHLFAGTAQDNVDDMFSKGRNPTRTKTHCKRGHPLSGDNLYVSPKNKAQHCMICNSMRQRAYKKRLKEKK